MTYSVIDIGSNTVKCGVYRIVGEKPTLIDFYTQQLGIIAKIEKGILPLEYIDTLAKTLNGYIEGARAYGEGKVFCFATESLRRVSNLEQIRQILHSRCKLDVELISGEAEAQFSYSGFRYEQSAITQGVMADMGGGSTEILKFTNDGIEALNSFRFGCLMLRQKFVKGRFPVNEENAAIDAYVTKELCACPWMKQAKTLCLIGGTGKAISDIATQLGYKDPRCFGRKEFEALFEHLSVTDAQTIALLEKYIPSRAETIIPGMCAYRAILGYINAQEVVISCAGIREGYLISKLKEEKND